MFHGSIPALVTPFKNGELDLDTLKKLVDWHVDQGSNGLVPVGTTGESPTLSLREHEIVVEEVVKYAAGRIPVIAGAGANNTAEGVRLIKHAADVGADGALVVTPYYNKPTQAGLIAHFTAIHEACGLPIIIYNIPGRSVVLFEPAPATTGIRPAAALTTSATTVSCSAWVRVGDSPVVPTGTSPFDPSAMCHSTSFLSVAKSSAPSVNGVTSAGSEPCSICTLLFLRCWASAQLLIAAS